MAIKAGIGGARPRPSSGGSGFKNFPSTRRTYKTRQGNLELTVRDLIPLTWFGDWTDPVGKNVRVSRWRPVQIVGQMYR